MTNRAPGAPKKSSLNYLALPLDFFDDEIVIACESLFEDGGTFLIKLMIHITKTGGYYTEWDQLKLIKFAKQNMTNKNHKVMSEIMDFLFKHQFFNYDLFCQFGILTSFEIQASWTSQMKLMKRTGKVITEYIASSKKGREEIVSSEETPHFFGRNPPFLRKKPPISSEGIFSENCHTIFNSYYNISMLLNCSSISSSSNGEKIFFQENENQGEGKETPPLSAPPPSLYDTTYMSVAMPLESCLDLYFRLPEFHNTRELLLKRCDFSLDPPSIRGEYPKGYERLRKWAMAFNRSNIRDGVHTRVLPGSDGWSRNFSNWLGRIAGNIDIKTHDPDEFITDKDFSNNGKNKNNANGSTTNSKQANGTMATKGRTRGASIADIQKVGRNGGASVQQPDEFTETYPIE